MRALKHGKRPTLWWHQYTGAGVVHASWTAGTAPYTLRRSRNPRFTEDGVTLVDEQNVTSHDDPVLNDGVTYYYDVQ